MKRAILYARVSGDDRGNDGRNLAGQLDMCREYAQKKGWRIMAELSEDEKGASGAAWDLPMLNRALEMARRHEFDVLICRELDRLARNLAKQLVIEGEFASSGVELAYVLGDYADTPEGALMKNIRAVISEYERYKITERMARGKRLKVEAGHVIITGGPPYGYRQANDQGKMTLAIVEEEAAVVRMIFDWYTGAEKIGTRALAQRLTDLGIPTSTEGNKSRSKDRSKVKPTGGWAPSTIAHILSNETYTGTWQYCKQRSAHHENPIAVSVPAIVSRETFQRADAQRKQNRNEPRRNVKHNYLLRYRATCGGCGTAMSPLARQPEQKLFLYYQCACAIPANKILYARTCTQRKYFRADAVDTCVWEWVKSYLADPARLAEGLAAYQSERERATAPLRDRLAVLDKLIGDNRGQLDRLLDLYLAGDFPKDTLLERKTRLTDTITALEHEREGLAAQLTGQSLSEDEVQSMFDFAAEVAQGLEHADHDFETRRRIIEILDVRATLAIENGEPVIYPRCRFWNGGSLSVVSNDTPSVGRNEQPFWILSARLPLCNMP